MEKELDQFVNKALADIKKGIDDFKKTDDSNDISVGAVSINFDFSLGANGLVQEIKKEHCPNLQFSIPLLITE